MLTSGHETVFERSEIEGAGRRRPRGVQGGGREDLLGIGAHHKALANEASRDGGCVEPRAIPGRPSRKGVVLQSWLPRQLEANDDLTLEEHREAFEEEFGRTVSTSTIGRAIAGLPDGPWPLKKSRG
jgi:hypothetical protein